MPWKKVQCNDRLHCNDSVSIHTQILTKICKHVIFLRSSVCLCHITIIIHNHAVIMSVPLTISLRIHCHIQGGQNPNINDWHVALGVRHCCLFIIIFLRFYLQHLIIKFPLLSLWYIGVCIVLHHYVFLA